MKAIPLALALGTLANAFVRLGAPARALTQARRALAILRASDDEVNLPFALATMAQALRVAGRRSEARTALEEAVGRLERLLGPESPNLASLLSELGHLYEEMAEPALAKAALTRAESVGGRGQGGAGAAATPPL